AALTRDSKPSEREVSEMADSSSRPEDGKIVIDAFTWMDLPSEKRLEIQRRAKEALVRLKEEEAAAASRVGAEHAYLNPEDPFETAIVNGEYEVFKRRLDRQPAIARNDGHGGPRRYEEGSPYLALAAYKGQLGMVRDLVAGGANVDW